MNLWTITLIMTAGVLTSFTDIRQRKIFNHHLLAFTVITLAGLTIFSLFATREFPAAVAGNLLAATCIAVGMYYADLWRPGDAKLFILYALIMPPTPYESTLLFPCVSHFVCSFLIASAIIIVLTLPEAARQVRILRDGLRAGKQPLFHPARLLPNFLSSLLMFLISAGVTFPLLSLIPFRVPVLLEFLSIYLVNAVIKQQTQRIRVAHPLVWMIIGIPLFALTFFKVMSPRIPSLLPFLQTMFIYGCWNFLLNMLFRSAKDQTSRVPFAPFLLAGCLLAYTPFLLLFSWFNHLLRR